MMKRTLLLLTIFFAASASVFAGGEAGNGGAGIRRDGKILTFAKSRIDLSPRGLLDVPGLKFLDVSLSALPIQGGVKSQLAEAYIVGVTDRKYFSIDKISKRERERLVKIYQDLLPRRGVKKSLEILAITLGKETYLLPGFFELDDQISQAAILFHEALWILKPNLDYEVVVAAEIAFENFVRNSIGDKVKYDPQFFKILDQIFDMPYAPVEAAALMDLKIDPRRDRVTLLEIIGQQALDRYFNGIINNPYYVNDAIELDQTLVKENIIEMIRANPHVNVFKALLERFQSYSMNLHLISMHQNSFPNHTPMASFALNPLSWRGTCKLAGLSYTAQDLANETLNLTRSSSVFLVSNYLREPNWRAAVSAQYERYGFYTPVTPAVAKKVEAKTVGILLYLEKVL